MRTIAIIIFAFLLFAACKKSEHGNSSGDDHYGTLVHKMKFTSSHESKSKGTRENLFYTQFGDYITSVTPTSFIGEFDLIRIYGNTIDTGNQPAFMTLLLSHSREDSMRYADFTNNAEITLTPGLCGPFANCNSDGTGGCFKDDAIFRLLHIQMSNLNQIVELPVQYYGINLSQFDRGYFQTIYSNDSVKEGNILTVDMFPLIGIISSTSLFYNWPLTIFLGMTDTTIMNSSGSYLDFPPALNQGLKMIPPFVWSRNFSDWTLKTPLENQIITITTTIGFDNQNMIQVYAGVDNIPYTSDDIIVYAPNFWERIYVIVSTK